MNPNEPLHATANETQRSAEGAEKAWEATKERATEALHSGERYVRENPGTSVLSVFGLGLLIGFALGWSIAHDDDDYSRSARKLVKRLGSRLNLD